MSSPFPLALTAPLHGLHVAPLQRDHHKLDWDLERDRSERVRVRAHTCECKTVVYELCAGGGLMFVRRQYRAGGETVVYETDRWITSHAEQVWQRLLLGEVY